MAYIAPIHRPNSVRHALRLRLFPDEEDCLVLAKANRLEIWKPEPGGTIRHAETKAVSGTISILQRLRPRDTTADLLFVGTERFHYFTVGWDHSSNRLITIDHFFDENEKHMRDAQSHDKCVVDPTGRFMIVLLWEGVINVLRMHTVKGKRQNLNWMDQIRLSELYIKCASFLHVETGHPKIAFLYQTRTDNPDCQLVTYRLTADDKNTEVSRFEVKDQIDRIEIEDPGAAILIPVGKGEEEQKRYLSRGATTAKAQLGGLLVVGETRLLYYDDAAKKTVKAVLGESSIFVAWAEYDVSHYFVGDDYGNMWLLDILLDGAVVTGLGMRIIAQTSRASNIVYLGNDILFVGSHHGDSQVFRVCLDDDSFTLLQTLPNISPILDLNIMDMGNREGEGQTTNEYSSGQARIVTGSGAHQDGSLRSVRSGVGLDDIGILGDFEHVRNLFAIRSFETPGIDTLIISSLIDTRVFIFSYDGVIEEVETFKSMRLDDPTLLARNLPNGRLLQITPTCILLIDLDDGVAVSIWTPAEGTITSASANDDWILLAVNGSILISLRIQQDLIRMQDNNLGETEQVACIHVPPRHPNIGIVGFWKSGTVSIVDIRSLESIHTVNLRRKDDNVSIPRDIALAQLLPPEISGPTLFISMQDGFVISFNVSTDDYSLSGRRSVVLGTRNARLQLLPRMDGIYSIFSTSEHPSLIYGLEGRIIYSAITADEAACVCPFDAEAFPDSIVVATSKEIKISKVDTQRRTHVNTLPMGETIRRIAYSRSERAFGLGCIHREVRDNEEVITSSFKLVDEVVFKQLGNSFILDSSPRVELVEAVIRAEMTDKYGDTAERFIVGTTYLDEEQVVAGQVDVRGRILVLGVDGERAPYLITSRNLKGGCRSLAIVEDKIVAALAKTVVVYSYNETSSTSAELKKIASYRPATYPTDLAVEGNVIGVADLMKSLTLVEFIPATDGQPAKLSEIARHYQSMWATAISHIDGQSWLEADAQGNLVVLRQNPNGVTIEDQRRMEVIGEMNLGEMVNNIRKVTVDASENAVIVPRAFLGTVEGGVYMFGTIAPRYQDLLIRFQSKLAEVLETTGNIHFAQYRSFRNEERESDGPFRFVDGDLIERFLDVDEKLQGEICDGLGPDVESMRNLVEELRRMH
ncbi:mono-functional DNA-alkylating methyl methanesulfonate N-term-domain-containing protein [Xylariomycetidae sp. FL2044]|nr:mono-functional DNA-alkylating methyl methanesulfonate N-term-domain-containing protein [Xylariomycetidae sp. FL2044]